MDFQVDHVQVAAPEGCEPAARAFFGDVLGLVERPKIGGPAKSGGCWFHVGAHEIHIGVVPDFVPAEKAHIALRAPSVDALDRLATRLSAAAYPVRWNEGLPGVARFFTTDPWGNRMEFLAHQEVR